MRQQRRPDAVWITWESQPRNRSMARDLGVPLHEVISKGNRLGRYVRCLLATARIVARDRPRVVFASNPSFVLTTALLILRPIFGFKLISDAHYGGVVAVNGSPALQRLLDALNRRVDNTIVTNQGHADRITELGGRPFVCPDPLPTLPSGDALSAVASKKAVLVVSSFDPDEPYEIIFEAARNLREHGFTFYVSGNYKKVDIVPEEVPDVELLGYVDHSTYWQYLLAASVVLDLTTFEDCLVCGAYESMAAEKPLVLSNTPALRDYFTQGTVFTDHQPDNIARAILRAYEDRETLSRHIVTWKRDNASYMRERIQQLRRLAGLEPQRSTEPASSETPSVAGKLSKPTRRAARLDDSNPNEA